MNQWDKAIFKTFYWYKMHILKCIFIISVYLDEFFTNWKDLWSQHPDPKQTWPGISGHAVDKDPPANVVDMGFMPGPGRFYTLWINEVRAPHLLSLSAATAEAHVPRAGGTREAITVRSTYTAVKSRLCLTRGSLCRATKTQCSHKQIKRNQPPKHLPLFPSSHKVTILNSNSMAYFFLFLQFIPMESYSRHLFFISDILLNLFYFFCKNYPIVYTCRPFILNAV